ncbi:glycosyltransferase [Streptomyces sp. RKND-216]|nr:glycosyltransferase [Streptomyces sp. RKND-216]
MAKAPQPGTVKTRLHPLLGPEGCAALQAELIRHTLALTTGHGLRSHLAHAPADARNALAALVPANVELRPQRTGALGLRLAAAVEDVFASGAGPLLVMGTDAPTLTAGHLTTALQALESRDVVLGPARDGGYYLIGMNRPQTGLFALEPDLWGGDRVFAATRALAEDEGLTIAALPELRDLDTPEDAAAHLDAFSTGADGEFPTRVAAMLRPAERP